MRNLIVPLILVGAFGLSVGSALAAQEVSLHKHTAAELKSVAIKPAAGSHRTQGGMGVEPTVKVSQAPIASSAARTIKTAPPRCPAAGVPLIF
jgi:hypothetical protein